MNGRRWITALLIGFTYCAQLSAQEATVPSSIRWDVGTGVREGHYQRRVLEELWQARAYDTADAYCNQYRSLLAKESDPYALWTLWKLEGMGRQRLDSPQLAERISKQLDQLVQEFELAESPRQPWVLLQAVRCQWMQATSELTTYLASSGRTDARDRALELIRTQLDALDSLSLKVNDLLAKSSRSNSKATSPKQATATAQSLRSDEVQGLANELLLLRIDCLNIRCQCYANNSNDLIGAASQMLKAIEDAKLRIPAEWIGNPRLNLAKARASLYLKEYDQALVSCTTGIEGLVDKMLVPRLQATLCDIYRLQGKFAEAQQAIDAAGGWSVSAELALASLELQLARLADIKESDAPIQELLEFKNRIGSRFGDHWMRRAEIALLRVVKTDQLVRDSSPSKVVTELFRTEAKQLLSGGKWEMARDRLTQAEESFRQEQSFSQALATAMEAAAVEQKFGKLEKAVSMFRQAGLQYSNEPNASAAHLMACWLAHGEAEKVRAASKSTATNTTGTSLFTWKELKPYLEEHLVHWSRSASSNQVRKWLDAQWVESGDRLPCLEMWRQAVVDEPSNVVSMTHLVCRTLQELLVVKYYGNGSRDILDASLQDWSVAAGKAKPPLQASAGWVLMNELAIDQRWLSLDQGPRKLFTREDLMPRPPFEDWDSWKEMIEKTRALVQCKDDTWSELQGMMREEPMRWQLVWPIAEALLDSLENASPEVRKTYGATLQQMGSRVREHARFSNDPKLASLRGELLEMRGRNWSQEQDAMLLAKSLRDRYIRNSIVELEIASMIRTSSEKTNGSNDERALRIYRQIAKGSKVGGPVWLESSFRTAQGLLSIGKRKEAEELLRLIQVTQPELPTIWKDRSSRMMSPP